jgi:hypothetical protein
MSLHARLRRLEAQLANPGRCQICRSWPPPVLRLLDARDPAAEEEAPHTVCRSCGWRDGRILTIVIQEQVVSA